MRLCLVRAACVCACVKLCAMPSCCASLNPCCVQLRTSSSPPQRPCEVFVKLGWGEEVALDNDFLTTTLLCSLPPHRIAAMCWRYRFPHFYTSRRLPDSLFIISFLCAFRSPNVSHFLPLLPRPSHVRSKHNLHLDSLPPTDVLYLNPPPSLFLLHLPSALCAVSQREAEGFEGLAARPSDVE